MSSTKSPKAAVGFPLPGHESHPESNGSIKMYITNQHSLFPLLYKKCKSLVLAHVTILLVYLFSNY